MIVAPLPSIVIRLVIGGRPLGPKELLYIALSVMLAFAGRTIVSAPLPAAQSGNVAASLFALTMASISEHWPSAAMLGLLVVTVIVAAVAAPCPRASSKAAPAKDQAILCCSRRPPCCRYSGKIAARSLDRAS